MSSNWLQTYLFISHLTEPVPRQFKCRKCEKPFSEELEFIGKRRKQTNRFVEMIVQQVLHSDMHNVGKQNDLTDEEVWSMVKYISEKKT